MHGTRKRHPFVIALIGPVGSGKSYVARILASKLGAVHLRTDDVRVTLRRRGQSMYDAVSVMRHRAEALLRRGMPVILDSDFVNPEKRRELERLLAPLGARLYFIEVDTPEPLILARLRENRYTADDFFPNAEEAIRVYYVRKKFRAKFESTLTLGGRFKPDFTVDNTEPLGPQIGKIVKEVGKRRN
ncbi:MAG: ATP-binding protein [bacterium]|nr:ATP-binding protein [bacterium]